MLEFCRPIVQQTSSPPPDPQTCLMNDRPRRPVLSLKPGTPRPSSLPPLPEVRWKCRPCGTAFTVPVEAADTEAVRCPSCNAKLGLASDFRAEPPAIDRLRARAAKP